MAQYSNLNLQGEGAEFLSARFKEFEPQLADPQKALYLSAIALVRAQHASSVSLLHRIGYVNDTIAMLDRAKRMSGGRSSLFTGSRASFTRNSLAFSVRANQPRLSSPGASITPTEHPMAAGCEKSIITSESWRSRGENARRRRSIYKN
jgi:hypothetical protein